MATLTVWIFQYDRLGNNGQPWEVQIPAGTDVDDSKRGIKVRMPDAKFHEASMLLWKVN